MYVSVIMSLSQISLCFALSPTENWWVTLRYTWVTTVKGHSDGSAFSYQMPFPIKMSLWSPGKGWIVSPSLCLWWSGKDQPSVFCSSRREGRTKSMLDWGELRGPHFLHVSEMKHFTLKRQNQINIPVWIGKVNFKCLLSLYSVIKLRWGVDHIFCVLCNFAAKAWSEALDHTELPQSLLHRIWQCFNWQSYKSQRSACNGIK